MKKARTHSIRVQSTVLLLIIITTFGCAIQPPPPQPTHPSPSPTQIQPPPAPKPTATPAYYPLYGDYREMSKTERVDSALYLKKGINSATFLLEYYKRLPTSSTRLSVFDGPDFRLLARLWAKEPKYLPKVLADMILFQQAAKEISDELVIRSNTTLKKPVPSPSSYKKISFSSTDGLVSTVSHLHKDRIVHLQDFRIWKTLLQDAHLK
jgi:hypothetical protein